MVGTLHQILDFVVAMVELVVVAGKGSSNSQVQVQVAVVPII